MKYTTRDLAKILNISRQQVAKLVKKHKFHLDSYNGYLFNKEEVKRIMSFYKPKKASLRLKTSGTVKDKLKRLLGD